MGTTGQRLVLPNHFVALAIPTFCEYPDMN